MDQATPMPKNTLTALLPVTLPMLASACLSWMAATLLAKVSAKLGGMTTENTIEIERTSENREEIGYWTERETPQGKKTRNN